jgi:hypothetical protein
LSWTIYQAACLHETRTTENTPRNISARMICLTKADHLERMNCTSWLTMTFGIRAARSHGRSPVSVRKLKLLEQSRRRDLKRVSGRASTRSLSQCESREREALATVCCDAGLDLPERPTGLPFLALSSLWSSPPIQPLNDGMVDPS